MAHRKTRDNQDQERAPASPRAAPTPSPEERRYWSRAGGLLSGAYATPEQRSERGRQSVRTQITKKVDPTGELARTNPAEFAVKYELTMKAHMAMMAAAHSAKAEEKRLAKLAKYRPLVLVVACPLCNEEAGYDVPQGYKQELCVTHWFASKLSAFNTMLDSAAEAASHAIAS